MCTEACLVKRQERVTVLKPPLNDSLYRIETEFLDVVLQNDSRSSLQTLDALCNIFEYFIR